MKINKHNYVYAVTSGMLAAGIATGSAVALAQGSMDAQPEPVQSAAPALALPASGVVDTARALPLADQTVKPVAEPAAHGDEPMTLEKMIELVGKRDPRVLVGELSARAAHERAARAWAGHYPQISVEYAAGLESSMGDQASQFGSTFSHSSDHFRGGQANLNWEIFAWGATQKRYLEAYTLAEAEEDRYRRAWDLIVLEVVENYINMYRLRKQLEITRQTLLGHSKLLKVVEDRVGAKLAPEARRSDALLRVQEVMADREDILSQLNEVNTTYRTLTGLEPPEDLVEPGISGIYTRDLACLSFDDNLRLAYSIHPQIMANLKTIQAAAYAVESMKADRLPKLNFYARYNDNRLFSTQGTTQPYNGRGYEVGINVTWTLWGSAYGNSIAEKMFLKEKSEADNERAMREVERNIRISRDALAASKGREAILNETLRLSDEVLKQRQQSFATQSMSDEAVSGLSNAYYSRARAATALLNLRMREVVASYTLLESSGLMVDVFPVPESERGPIGPAPVRNFFPGRIASMNPPDGLPRGDVVGELTKRKVLFDTPVSSSSSVAGAVDAKPLIVPPAPTPAPVDVAPPNLLEAPADAKPASDPVQPPTNPGSRLPS
nr:TolC family protein [Trinickia fusca]